MTVHATLVMFAGFQSIFLPTSKNMFFARIRTWKLEPNVIVAAKTGRKIGASCLAGWLIFDAAVKVIYFLPRHDDTWNWRFIPAGLLHYGPLFDTCVAMYIHLIQSWYSFFLFIWPVQSCLSEGSHAKTDSRVQLHSPTVFIRVLFFFLRSGREIDWIMKSKQMHSK